MVRLHLVDGTYELFRAHFSKRPDHVAPGGAPAKATVGLAAALIGLLHDAREAVTHIGVAFDNPIRSFRNDLFPGYKSDEGVPSELRAQFDAAEDAVRALGIAVWSMDRFEADDALATAAARFRDEVDQVRILTPDKDLGQCIRGTRVVQVRRGEPEIDEPALRAGKGVGPRSIPDLLALAGDDADGIPGLPGFGWKTSAALLGRYERIEAIPRLPLEWPPAIRGAKTLAATLEARREEALLYRRLATLRENATLRDGTALARSLDDLAFRGIPRGAFNDWCDRLGVRDLRARPARWA